MSMLCTLSRVTAAQAEAMRADPVVADELLHEPFPPAPVKTGLFARLTGKVPPPPPPRKADWIGAARQYAVDQQWHILHFLLTGLPEGGDFPACFLCNEGEEVGVDLGYGRPRLFTAEQAGRIAAHLRALDEAEVRRRYAPADIDRHDIYWLAEGSDADHRQEARWLWETMQEVAAFAEEAARDGGGLVVEIY